MNRHDEPTEVALTRLPAGPSLATTCPLSKVRKHGPISLYEGAAASITATFCSHFLWFGCHNKLDAELPHLQFESKVWAEVTRNGGIGFCSSLVADVGSNAIRVIKTNKQTAETTMTVSKEASTTTHNPLTPIPSPSTPKW